MSQAFADQTVFITGASSGIGAEVARVFAAEGAQVAVAARRADRLAALVGEIEAAGGTALAVECDVRDRASINTAVAQTVAAYGGIDVVLANAGFGVTGDSARLETDDYRRQFETNVFGVIDTVHATLPELIKRNGRLALVGSIMGLIGMGNSAPYCASKFAVVGFAESIGYDLAQRGVSVTCINPGIVASEIRSVNNRGELTNKPDPAPTWITMPADKAARDIVRAIRRRKATHVVTGHGKVITFIARHFPRSFRFLARKATGGKGRKGLEKK